MKLSLTKLQWDEICHKLVIVAVEPDLQESYDLDQREVDVIYDLFYKLAPTKGRYNVEFDDDYLDLLIGELENSMDIAVDNIFAAGDNDWRGLLSSIGRVVKQMKAYRVPA